MPQKMSNAEFAAAIKQRVPQLKDVPDEELVRKVLQRRPELITKLTSPPGPPPKPEAKGTRPTDFSSRIIDRIGENAQSMSRMPGEIMQDARKRYDARKGEGNPALNAAKSAFEGAYYSGVEPAAKGVYSVSTPGTVQRVAEKDDPANIAGDALMQFMPGGEEGARAFDQVRGKAYDPVKPGSIFGAETRGKGMLDRVDAAAQGVPVNHLPAYEWAKKAMELGKHGWTVPKPITDFVNLIESSMKPGADKIGPGQFMDRGADSSPLTYEISRNFEQALGQKIPWEMDQSGKMNGLMKKMREALGTETATALKPYGLDTPYLRGKAEMEKVYKSGRTARAVGRIGGKVAGYGAGGAAGHPFLGGQIGGKAGESAAGSLVKRAARMGAEDPIDIATRRGAGGMSLSERFRVATDKVNSLKMQASRNPGDYNLVSQLQKAEGELETLQKEAMPKGYQGAPKAVSRAGGGGANYSAEDLAALKKKHGIPLGPSDIPVDPGGVSMKMFITKADEVVLRNLGYTDEMINKMKPEQAGQILSSKRPVGGMGIK